MRIKNETTWRTDDIRRLVRAVAERELDKSHFASIRVRVKWKRREWQRLGDCWMGSMRRPTPVMRLFLGRRDQCVDTVLLAHTIAHELGHAKGIEHREMTTPRYGYAEGWREHYAWALAFPVRRKEQKPAPTQADRAAAAISHARRMLRLAETRLKRAQTIHRRWARRVKYHEVRLTAAR